MNNPHYTATPSTYFPKDIFYSLGMEEPLSWFEDNLCEEIVRELKGEIGPVSKSNTAIAKEAFMVLLQLGLVKKAVFDGKQHIVIEKRAFTCAAYLCTSKAHAEHTRQCLEELIKSGEETESITPYIIVPVQTNKTDAQNK